LEYRDAGVDISAADEAKGHRGKPDGNSGIQDDQMAVGRIYHMLTRAQVSGDSNWAAIAIAGH